MYRLSLCLTEILLQWSFSALWCDITHRSIHLRHDDHSVSDFLYDLVELQRIFSLVAFLQKSRLNFILIQTCRGRYFTLLAHTIAQRLKLPLVMQEAEGAELSANDFLVQLAPFLCFTDHFEQVLLIFQQTSEPRLPGLIPRIF